MKCLTDKGVDEAGSRRAQRLADRQQRDPVRAGLRRGAQAEVRLRRLDVVDDQSVPDWDNQKGGQIFEQMLTKASGKIDGVLAANDGLGNAAIAVLKKNNLQVPVTGQDATVAGPAEHPRRRPVHDGLQGRSRRRPRRPPTPPSRCSRAQEPARPPAPCTTTPGNRRRARRARRPRSPSTRTTSRTSSTTASSPGLGHLHGRLAAPCTAAGIQ